jgi:hypothetical protein
VKWADHFGGALSIAQMVEGEETADGAQPGDPSVSWSDRKKRDRLREKDLLAKAKYVLRRLHRIDCRTSDRNTSLTLSFFMYSENQSLWTMTTMSSQQYRYKRLLHGVYLSYCPSARMLQKHFPILPRCLFKSSV